MEGQAGGEIIVGTSRQGWLQCGSEEEPKQPSWCPSQEPTSQLKWLLLKRKRQEAFRPKGGDGSGNGGQN